MHSNTQIPRHPNGDGSTAAAAGKCKCVRGTSVGGEDESMVEPPDKAERKATFTTENGFKKKQWEPSGALRKVRTQLGV